MEDSTPQPAKRPWHLWVVGFVSLLWNSFGAMDFVMTQARNKAYMSACTPEQLHFYYGYPPWVVAAWGIAVGGGVIGSLLLLLGRRQATGLFVVSFLGMILTDFYNLAVTDGFRIMGGVSALLFAAVIRVIGALLWAYSRTMATRGTLR